jgi:catechol 2,3-dioxygenase-like lactoylglutathione lyase family enzyme
VAGEAGLSRIGTIMLGVEDLDRSLVFYRDTLGLSVQFSSAEFAFLDAGGVALALRQTSNLPGPVELRTELVFHVDDIDAAYSLLRQRGVAFRVEPRIVTGDQLAADFRDPDGHVLSIFGPRGGGAGRA